MEQMAKDSKVLGLDEMLKDPALKDRVKSITETNVNCIIPLKNQFQLKAFEVMLGDAKDRGLLTLGLLDRKKDHAQSLIRDCILFALAVGDTFTSISVPEE